MPLNIHIMIFQLQNVKSYIHACDRPIHDLAVMIIARDASTWTEASFLAKTGAVKTVKMRKLPY